MKRKERLTLASLGALFTFLIALFNKIIDKLDPPLISLWGCFIIVGIVFYYIAYFGLHKPKKKR